MAENHVKVLEQFMGERLLSVKETTALTAAIAALQPSSEGAVASQLDALEAKYAELNALYLQQGLNFHALFARVKALADELTEVGTDTCKHMAARIRATLEAK